MHTTDTVGVLLGVVLWAFVASRAELFNGRIVISCISMQLVSRDIDRAPGAS